MTPTQRRMLHLIPASLALLTGLGLSANSIATLLTWHLGMTEQRALLPTAVLMLVILWLATERAIPAGSRFAIPLWIAIVVWSAAHLTSVLLYGPGTVIGAAFVTMILLVAASGFEIAVRINHAERLAPQATGA